ncbi:hypothetical protein BP00DRAFT_425721 [Aspergillus indologenus CBS 114.80]|uniref:Rho-GAP domain-containing protein n=1 Tax=Aspergillus indologenus CBS 114.80 TaxID=1450541 RepID=A0A2V5I3E3_9EURO|nr:hypothetical protein BP00DRAFT_425721 [Aspergillus indologenus CBS 114.80]
MFQALGMSDLLLLWFDFFHHLRPALGLRDSLCVDFVLPSSSSVLREGQNAALALAVIKHWLRKLPSSLETVKK